MVGPFEGAGINDLGRPLRAGWLKTRSRIGKEGGLIEFITVEISNFGSRNETGKISAFFGDKRVCPSPFPFQNYGDPFPARGPHPEMDTAGWHDLRPHRQNAFYSFPGTWDFPGFRRLFLPFHFRFARAP
jgi:hypothetical protein